MTAMKKSNRGGTESARVCWAGLEGWVRERVQGYVQDLLQEEVTELLGRGKSQRRPAVDALPGSRNGLGKPRKLTLGCGTITVRRPRVRALEERFESRILPLFARRTPAVDELLPELYLHGLSEGDFDLALRGLLGDEAPLSSSTVARLKIKWQAEFDVWSARPLSELEGVYLWADGIYVKAGLEKEKAAILVVVAGLSDGQKVVLAVRAGYRESTESWSALLRDLKARGMNAPRLVIADGHLGLWGALAGVYPQAEEQRCWNHRIVNVSNELPSSAQPPGRELLTKIPYAESRKEAERCKKEFQDWCRRHGHDKAAALLDHDWERMVTFYRYPKEHWTHLRTTNVVESPFASVRLRTEAAKRYKKVDNATAVIWKVLLVAEKRFRKLNAPHLMKDVYQGVRFVDGVRESKRKNRKDAA
jgi:putative transposase